MFLGRKVVDLPRIAAGHYQPFSEHRRQRSRSRDHFAKLPLPSTKFGKTLAFNAKICLV